MLSKSDLRRLIKEQRKALTPNQMQSFNLQIQQRLLQLPIVRRSKVILLYYPINHEVDTIAIIQSLLMDTDKIICLPACTPAKSIKAGKIGDLDHLQRKQFNLWEPGPDSEWIAPERIDLICLPGLAFDRHGIRLGYGAGYYDRFLKSTPNAFKLGLAYDFQILEQIPSEEYDLPVDAILTQQGLITIQGP